MAQDDYINGVRGSEKCKSFFVVKLGYNFNKICLLDFG